jgi:hypothetical protein
MTRRLSREGKCRIDALTVDGRPVAMGIVLRSRDRAFFWKIAYDEDLRRNRPAFSSRWKRRRSSKRTNPVGFAWRAVLRRRFGWVDARSGAPRAAKTES